MPCSTDPRPRLSHSRLLPTHRPGKRVETGSAPDIERHYAAVRNVDATQVLHAVKPWLAQAAQDSHTYLWDPVGARTVPTWKHCRAPYVTVAAPSNADAFVSYVRLPDDSDGTHVLQGSKWDPFVPFDDYRA